MDTLMQTDTLLQKHPRQLSKQDLVEIYELLNPPLYRYAVRLLGDPHLAEDCVAETFSRFLKVVNRGLGPKDNIKAYLYRIVHNWITDYYRHRIPENNLEAGQLKEPSENPAMTASQNMEQERVRKALLNLPEEQRQVIMLRFYENWPHEETAAALGKTVEATRALQYRALNGLRSMLIIVEE
jgi:RNA polymerase sigma-70 factor, ECF subfamily